MVEPMDGENEVNGSWPSGGEFMDDLTTRAPLNALGYRGRHTGGRRRAS